MRGPIIPLAVDAVRAATGPRAAAAAWSIPGMGPRMRVMMRAKNNVFRRDLPGMPTFRTDQDIDRVGVHKMHTPRRPARRWQVSGCGPMSRRQHEDTS